MTAVLEHDDQQSCPLFSPHSSGGVSAAQGVCGKHQSDPGDSERHDGLKCDERRLRLDRRHSAAVTGPIAI